MSLPMFSFFGLMFLEQNFEAGSSWAKVFSRFLGILYLLGAQSCCLSVRIMLFKMYGVIQWGSNLCIWSNHTYVFVLKNTYRSLLQLFDDLNVSFYTIDLVDGPIQIPISNKKKIPNRQVFYLQHICINILLKKLFCSVCIVIIYCARFYGMKFGHILK